MQNLENRSKMPIDRRLYPPNWPDISLEVRRSADWKCPQCSRPCRKEGESQFDFESRLRSEHPQWVPQLVQGRKRHWKRFELHASHDHEKEGNLRGENGIKALCCVCHLRHDLPYLALNTRRHRERRGQLSLLWPPAQLPTPVNSHLDAVQPHLF